MCHVSPDEAPDSIRVDAPRTARTPGRAAAGAAGGPGRALAAAKTLRIVATLDNSAVARADGSGL
jgi:hypothetical protein